MPTIPSAGKWRFWRETESGWQYDGEYDAPKKEVSVKDGRTATTKFSRSVDGSEIMAREPIRSTRKGTVLEFWMHHTGAERAIYDYLNEIIKTGVGLRIETHVGIDLMGTLEDLERTWRNWHEKDGQMFTVRATMKFYDVDGTGTGW
jgi:hypothetical protein